MRFTKSLVIFIFVIGISLSIYASENNKQHVNGIGLYESLYNAIEMDSVNEIKQFIDFGADVNHRYDDGKTPLMFASSLGNLGSVQTLIELGANINLKSDEGKTALDYARNNHQISTLDTLQNFISPQQTQSKRQMVTTIQFYLNRLGYIAGDLDGVYGDKTRTSLIKFSEDSKQVFSPEISERQIEALFNSMSGIDDAEFDHSRPTVDVEIETYSETNPSKIENELAISETETNGTLR